jgi:hypothetical protein
VLFWQSHPHLDSNCLRSRQLSRHHHRHRQRKSPFPFTPSPISIPQGIYLDQNTGKFVWTPSYNQAGEYTFKFATIDTYGGRDSKEIKVLIDNIDRAPTLNISDRATTTGKEVKFTIDAKDPDLNSVLTYTTNNLPLGATLNATTGEFKWTPTAGQLGSYLINFSVNDGELTVDKMVTIKVLKI